MLGIPKDVQPYALNKLLSFALVFGCIVFTEWWLGYTIVGWQLILLFIIIFGYSHFIIGFYYQLRSFLHKENAWQYFLTFSILVLLSIILAQVLFERVGFVVALFIGFVYFLLHGLLNEQTLIQRQTGVHIPLIYIFSLAVFVMSLLTYTIPDPTFFFDRTLNFLNPDAFFLVQIFKTYSLEIIHFTYVFWTGMILSFLILIAAWWKHRNHAVTLLLGGGMGLVLLLTLGLGALPYIYMYLIVVGYHFCTWFLFYVREMRGRGARPLTHFLGLHLIVLVPFVWAGISFMQGALPSDFEFLIDYQWYVMATYVHISTSFMNDHWFQQLQNRFFQLLD